MSRLSDKEYALLSDFSYIDLQGYHLGNDPISLGAFLDELLDHRDTLKPEQLELLEKMQTNPELRNLKLVQYENKDSWDGDERQSGNGNTGFVAMGFVTTEGSPIAVYRGSEPIFSFNDDSAEDWTDNLKNMLLGNPSTQYDQANQFYETLLGNPSVAAGDLGTVVGHSKGGNLAAYVASSYGELSGVLINPLPLHENFANINNLDSCDITTYVVKNDFIAILLTLFDSKEIEFLLSMVSDKELATLLGFNDASTAEIMAQVSGILIKIRLRSDFENAAAVNIMAKKLLQYSSTVEKMDNNFHETLIHNNRDTYHYPGEIVAVESSSSSMLDAHAVSNIYDHHYKPIEVNLMHTEELTRRLASVNQRLLNIDRQLDSALASLRYDWSDMSLKDFNLQALISRVTNGIKIVISDLEIGRSSHISKCMDWLREVESEFATLEGRLVGELENSPVAAGSTRARHESQFI